MACHEIAALRLGLMHVLGRQDEAERLHELAELGSSVAAGPIRALCEATNLAALKANFEAAVSELETRVAATRAGDPKSGYLRSLVILTKQVELDLDGHIADLTRLYRNLEDMHDFVHELYPQG